MDSEQNKYQRHRILVVDDQPLQRSLECDILSDAGYVTAEAANGKQALSKLNESTFDLMVLKMKLPDASGPQLCQQIYANPRLKRLPIVLVIENHHKEDLADSLIMKTVDFIQKPFRPITLLKRVQACLNHSHSMQSQENLSGIFLKLAQMIEERIPQLKHRCARLAHRAVTFGEALNLDRDDLDALYKGAILHDIGMLTVPENILIRKGPLTEEEWDTIYQHTIVGERLYRDIEPQSAVCSIIRSHHERFDGSGYPDQLAQKKIPLLARVFQIVDIHDALSQARPYKQILSTETTIERLKDITLKGWCDPELMEVYLDILTHYPHHLMNSFNHAIITDTSLEPQKA